MYSQNVTIINKYLFYICYMIFNIDKFKIECAKGLASVTKVEGLSRMDLHRFRKGKFSKALTTEKFMIICKELNVSPEIYTFHDLEMLPY